MKGKETMSRKAIDPLTEDEINKLLAVATTLNSTEHLFMRLLATTGAQIGELYGTFDHVNRCWVRGGLRKKDISFHKKTMRVWLVHRKKSLSREIELVDETTITLLKKFTKTMSPDDYVFCDTTTYDTLAQAPRKCARNAGIDKPVSCHSFRHHFITDLVKKGADIQRIQYLAGHRDIETTLRYTK